MYGLNALHPAAFDAYRVDRQREADHRDAARRAVARGVGHEPVARVVGAQEVIERAALEIFEQRVVSEVGRHGEAIAPSTIACASVKMRFR